MRNDPGGPAECAHNGLTVLPLAIMGIGQPYVTSQSRGVFVNCNHHRMRMILIPLAAVVAIVVAAMTRRPAKDK